MSELESLRNAYGDTLAELGEKNKDIIVLDADLSCSTKTYKFASKFPERFFNVGIAEQNMAGVSAGLAASGKTVFMSTFGIFMIRGFEQIRNTIAYSNLNVKLVASHLGLTVGPDGSSHQLIEDLALFRALPNFRVFVPCDARETSWLTKSLLNYKGPCYMRVSRMSVKPVYPSWENEKFNELKADVLKEGDNVSLISCGLLVKESLDAAELLKKEGISAEVVNMHCLKPIDDKQIIKSAKKTGCIVTAEEHQINNGLGSAVSEVLVENYPVPMQRVGVQDTFGESGAPGDLMKKYGLTAKDIYNASKNVIGRK